MHAVVTRLKVKAGGMDELAAMFRATHPPLAAHETEWQSVRFLADRATDSALVVEIWHSLDAYRRFAASEAVLRNIGQMARLIEGEPEVTVMEVLGELERTSGTAQGLSFGPD